MGKHDRETTEINLFNQVLYYLNNLSKNLRKLAQTYNFLLYVIIYYKIEIIIYR